MVNYVIKLNDKDYISIERRYNKEGCTLYANIESKKLKLGGDWVSIVKDKLQKNLQRALSVENPVSLLMLMDPHSVIDLPREHDKLYFKCSDAFGNVMNSCEITKTTFEMTHCSKRYDSIDKSMGFNRHSSTVKLGDFN